MCYQHRVYNFPLLRCKTEHIRKCYREQESVLRYGKENKKWLEKKKNICIKGINFALIMYLLVMGIGVDLKTDYQPRKVVAATHVAIQNWSLYGRKNKVIYCNDSCTYWDRFKDMAKVWNAHKSGVLKQWKNGDIVTCRVQSAAELSSRSARTYSTGFIVFNTNQMRRHEAK